MACGSRPVRLALAFLIGAAAGPWFNLTHPTTLDALLNALVIAVPPLLAVLLILYVLDFGLALLLGVLGALSRLWLARPEE